MEDLLISSQILSKPLDSVMAEECRIVLIPKLASNLAVSSSLGTL